MTPTWESDGVALYLGDCLEVLPTLAANSVDAVVTDPPYGLEFMGKEWDRFSGGFSKNEDWEHGNLGGLPRQRHRNIKCPECDKWIYDHPPDNCTCGGIRRTQMRQYEQFGYAWAVEALRVAKPGAHLLAFGGTRTWHRLACALEDAGWEIRDTIMWVYGSGFPKSHDISKAIDREAGAEREGAIVGGHIGVSEHGGDGKNAGELRTSVPHSIDKGAATRGIPATPEAARWQGWGTALKPAWEPIIVARKPVNCTVAQNVLTWGTGGINVDGCRVDVANGDERSGGFGLGKRPWQTGDVGGNTLRVGSEQGRWPANLIHDGSDEAVRGFPQTGTSSGGKSGHTGAYGGGYREEHYGGAMPGFGDSGSAARFFYCAKASKQDRDEGLDNLPMAELRALGDFEGTPEHTPKKNIQRRNHHPTVKPTALMRYLCKLVTPPGGVVLDPFLGSGSTGKAAVLEGFGMIGVEKDAEYSEIARKRIEQAQMQLRLPMG